MTHPAADLRSDVDATVMRHVPDHAMNVEVPICLVTVPVLSRSADGPDPVAPTIEIHASVRPWSAYGAAGLRGDPSPGAGSTAWAKARLDQAMVHAADATRAASLSAWHARQGTVPPARAEGDAAAAEVARAQVGELAIASALAEEERLAVRIATLERQRARAGMRASVASLLMTHEARVGAAATPSRVPMFALVQDGATPMRAEVFEDDLLRLVAGQDVTLSLTDQTIPVGATPQVEEVVVDLRAQLVRPRPATQDPSRLVQGMFLSAELRASAHMTALVARHMASTEAGSGQFASALATDASPLAGAEPRPEESSEVPKAATRPAWGSPEPPAAP